MNTKRERKAEGLRERVKEEISAFIVTNKLRESRRRAINFLLSFVRKTDIVGLNLMILMYFFFFKFVKKQKDINTLKINICYFIKEWVFGNFTTELELVDGYIKCRMCSFFYEQIFFLYLSCPFYNLWSRFMAILSNNVISKIRTYIFFFFEVTYHYTPHLSIITGYLNFSAMPSQLYLYYSLSLSTRQTLLYFVYQREKKCWIVQTNRMVT